MNVSLLIRNVKRSSYQDNRNTDSPCICRKRINLPWCLKLDIPDQCPKYSLMPVQTVLQSSIMEKNR